MSRFAPRMRGGCKVTPAAAIRRSPRSGAGRHSPSGGWKCEPPRCVRARLALGATGRRDDRAPRDDHAFGSSLAYTRWVANRLLRMAPELRAQIFSLKAQDIPITRIAATLGLSEGAVRYQLERRARLIPANGATTIPDAPLAVQPSALQAARESFALEQIEAQRVSLRAQRQEAERRLQKPGKAPGDSSGAVLPRMGRPRHIRQQLDALKNRPGAAPAPPMPAYPQLTQLSSCWRACQPTAARYNP